MTEEGIFLGGGDMAGTFKDWTIPNIWGEFHPGKNGPGGSGAFRSWRSGSGEDGSNPYDYLIRFDLNYLNEYKNHNNTFGKMYPNHYNVEFWIKYK